MSETAERILDTMQTLIQTRGYSAVSYQDVADELGLRKASIHYHFSTKTALGVAVVERYRATMAAALAGAREQGAGGWKLLETYLGPYRQFGATDDRICLCGALAGEFLALPEKMQRAVAAFFDEHQAWLETLLRDGRRHGEFQFEGPARRQATLTVSALQGALIVKRAGGDARQIDDVVKALRARLR